MATLAFKTLDPGLLVLVGTDAAPDATSWDAYCAAVTAMPSHRLRVVCFTDGGHPTRDQLARVDQAVGKRNSRILLVSASAATRVNGAMASAFAKNMNGVFCSPDDLIDGLANIGITEQARISEVLVAAAELAKLVTPDGRLAALGTASPHRYE